MIDAIYDTCVRCGLCLPSCPTYLETMTETSGPRGRISLIKAVDEGRIDLLSPGFTAQMSECLDCRACEAVCPSGVRYGRLVESARASIEVERAKHRSPLDAARRRLLVRGLFGNLHLMRAAAALTRFAQRTGLLRLAPAFGLGEASALAPEIPDRFFAADGRRHDADNPAGLAFLHTGCVMTVAYGAVHEASVRMLNRAKLSVTIPRNQGCCGAIAVHEGDPDFARSLAKRNIEAFERSGADVYVVNAAGCGSTLKEYGELFAGDPAWAELAAKFSDRVRDIVEVLDAMELEPHIGRLDATVTYQEPCHLVHAQRICAAPRRLLAKIPGLRLIEMDESSVCCGSAGVYNLTEPDMSRRLRARKVRNVEASGATVVATANPGCAMQVAAGLREGGVSASVKHIVELLDDAYASSTPSP